MSLFLNKKTPPNPLLLKWGNYRLFLSKESGIFPSLAKRGKGRFYNNIFIDDRSPSGFTLIEVLVSVAILSIVLASIYGTFFLSHRAIEGMDESMTKLQESRRALDILKRELDSAVSYFRIQDRDVYGKQASQLTFTAFSVLRPGLSRIAYYIEDNDGKLYLYKKVASPFGKQETEGVEIIEDLDAFAIEVRYNDKWIKIWDTDINKNMPDEVRISLSMMIKGRKVTLSDVSKPMFGKHV
jgi:prepilin-type N-terminal cleavage/methylation domain-containing protein